MENYLVILFENKIKKKIIKKYITFNKAKKFFDSLIKESQNVIFEKKFKNGHPTKTELGLVELSSKQLLPVYVTDEMGRNLRVKLENEGMTLVEIHEYKTEELIYDYKEKKKITANTLIKKYLKGDGIKMVSSLNNKIIIQNDEEIYLFSLKNDGETKRFIDCISGFFYGKNRGDCIFVKDVSKPQKKYLFDLLESKGFDKKNLYRKYTTFPL